MSYRQWVLSDHPVARTLRGARRACLDFTLPAPRLLVRPLLWTYVSVRTVWHFVLRVFVCEPLFKAYCKQYGRGVRTGVFVHWIQGKGDIIVGDDVLVDGKCSIGFASRFCDRPMLEIGSHIYIGHNCSFTIAKQICIGSHCYLSANVALMDSSGHPLAPEARAAGLPPSDDQVKPIRIGNNVWIGQRAMIFPGVTIGEGSVVGAGSIVTKNVPPRTVVAGVPAKPIRML